MSVSSDDDSQLEYFKHDFSSPVFFTQTLQSRYSGASNAGRAWFYHRGTSSIWFKSEDHEETALCNFSQLLPWTLNTCLSLVKPPLSTSERAGRQ